MADSRWWCQQVWRGEFLSDPLYEASCLAAWKELEWKAIKWSSFCCNHPLPKGLCLDSRSHLVCVWKCWWWDLLSYDVLFRSHPAGWLMFKYTWLLAPLCCAGFYALPHWRGMRGFVASLASSLRRLRLRQDGGGATHVQTPGKQLLLLLRQHSRSSPLLTNNLISVQRRVRLDPSGWITEVSEWGMINSVDSLIALFVEYCADVVMFIELTHCIVKK